MSSIYSKPAIARVYHKVTGELLGFSVEPEKLYEYGNLGMPKVNYRVTCDEQTGRWACTCPSRKPCKHIKACQELNEIRLGVRPYDVVKHAEEVAAAVSPEKVTEMSSECSQDAHNVPSTSGDVSAAQHIVDQKVAAYELTLVCQSIDYLRSQVRLLRLRGVKLNAKKTVIVEALVKNRRMHLEMHAEAERLESLPELPLLHEEDRAEAYLQELKPVIEAPKALPQARKFMGTEGNLGGTCAFSLTR